MAEFKTCSAQDRAIAHSRVGNLSAAVEVLERHLLEEGNDGHAWELLGGLAFVRDDFELAQRSLEHASVFIPLSVNGQLLLARCYDRSSYVAAADAIYRHVATLGELPTDLLEPLASGLGRYGHFELALNVCRTAAERMPDNPDPLMGIVHYMRRLRRPVEQVLPAMHRVHQLEPRNAEFRVSLAWMLHEAGRTEEGARLLDGVAYDKFSCVRCLTLMQHVLERAGRLETATLCRARLNALAGKCQGSDYDSEGI